jgi:hypothetical protein
MVVKSMRISWIGNVPHVGKLRSSYWIWAGKCEGKSPRGGHRSRWDDNMNRDVKEMEWDVVDLVHLAEGRIKRGRFL